jgi:hypothetical protein
MAYNPNFSTHPYQSTPLSQLLLRPADVNFTLPPTPSGPGPDRMAPRRGGYRGGRGGPSNARARHQHRGGAPEESSPNARINNPMQSVGPGQGYSYGGEHQSFGPGDGSSSIVSGYSRNGMYKAVSFFPLPEMYGGDRLKLQSVVVNRVQPTNRH